MEEGHFLVLSASKPERYPHEVFWDNIRTLHVLKDRSQVQPTHLAVLPALCGLIPSRAALPARRNRISIPSNGSTGAAHP
ncbi:hypothetical protein D9M71_351820 [compost metagenome]